MYYLNEYEIGRAYGGPEEGGWYYDYGKFIRCHGTYRYKLQADLELAAKCGYLEELREGLHSPDSVLSEGNWPVIYIEKEAGQSFPQTIPHYE